MAIFKNLDIKIKDDIATLSEKIYVYQNDRGIELNIRVNLAKIYFNDLKNVSDEVGIFAGATIVKPNKKVISMEKIQIVDSVIKFRINEELTDDIDEIGVYKIQFHLYDRHDNRLTLPPVEFEVKELIGYSGENLKTGIVDKSSVGSCTVAEDSKTMDIFLNGRYIKTVWATGDLISADKLNKIETAVETLDVKINDLEDSKSDKLHKHKYQELEDLPYIPQKTSDLENDAGYITNEDIDVSQSHIHSNMGVLNGITEETIDNWNNKSEIVHNHASIEVLYTNESDTSISTVKDALDKLLYFDLSINFSSTTNTTVEKGAVLLNTLFNWSYNKEIVSQKFNNEALVTSLRSYLYTPSISSNKTFTLSANDGKKEFSRSVTFNFLNGRYWGVSDSVTYDSGFIKTLSKELSSSRGKTFTVNSGVGQYIFYCIPSSFGLPTFTVGGFSGGFSKVEVVQFTNDSGFTESYDIWKSANGNLGNTTVVVS